MPTPKKVQTKHPSSNVCCFCNSAEDNELLYGKIHRMGDIVTHYYCLLLSSNMEQNGADNEGILGFMREDILKELRRGKRLICSYCKSNGATLGCCITRCKRVFHLPCGQKAGSLHQFFGQFKSYCSSHRPMQRVDSSLQNSQQTCAICYEDVVPRPTNSTLWASCCRKNAWFHRNCVQQLAMSAGYFFKCPLCNNKSTFQTTMLNYGIYIPERDASWELVPNAFQELLHRHNRCDSPTPCLCPKGRNYDMQGTRWELVLCHLCGSQGLHLGCGNLKWTDPKWECNECKEMLANAHERNDEPVAETNGNEGSTPNIADQSRSRGRRSNARSQHRLARGHCSSQQSLAYGKYAANQPLRSHNTNTNGVSQPYVTHPQNISGESNLFTGLCSSRACCCGESSSSQQETRTRCSCHRLKENTFKPEYFSFNVIGPNDVKMSYRKFFLRTLKVATMKNKTSCKQYGTCTEQLAHPERSLPCTESSNQQLVECTTSESPPDHRNLLMADKTVLCSENVPLTSSSDGVESSNTVGYMHSTPQFPLLTPALHKFSFSPKPEYDSVNSNQAQSSEYIQRGVSIPSQKTSYSFHNPLNSLLPNSWFRKIDTFADVEEKLKSVAFTSDLMQHENHASHSFLSFKHILSAASNFVHNKRNWLSQSLPVESQLSDGKDFGLSYLSSSKQNFTATSASISEQGGEFQNHNTSGEAFSSNDSFSQFPATPDHSCVADSLLLNGNRSDIAVQTQLEIESVIPNSTNVPVESSTTAITPSNQRHKRDTCCLSNRAVHGKSIETRCSISSSESVSSALRISGIKTRSKSFEESRKLRCLDGRARLWNTTSKGSKNNEFIVKRSDTPRPLGNTLHNNEGAASSNETTAPVPTVEPKSKQKECDTNKLQCKRNRSSAEGQRIRRCPSPMLTRSSSRHTSRRLRCRKAPRRAVYLDAYYVPMHKPKSHYGTFLNIQIDSGRKRVQHAVAAPSSVAKLTSSAGEDKSEMSSTVEAPSHSSMTAGDTEMQNELHSVENLDADLAEDGSDSMKCIPPLVAQAAGCSTQSVLLEGSGPYVKDISAKNHTEVNSACVSTSNLNSIEHSLSLELTPDVENKKNCNKIIQDGREVQLAEELYTNTSYDKPETPSTNCHCVKSCASHSATISLTRKRRWQRCNSFSEDSSSSLSPLNDSHIPIKRVRCHSNDYLENTSSAFLECEENIKYSNEDGITLSKNNMLHSTPMSREAQLHESTSGENTFQRSVHTFDDVLKIKAKALAARKFRPPSRTELLQREMLRKLQHHSF